LFLKDMNFFRIFLNYFNILILKIKKIFWWIFK
jgi:hypothetical protein